MKDLQQANIYGDKRSAEIDNASQLDLLNSLKLPEVLRFEIRLKSRKLKPLLAQIGHAGPLHFQNLFNASLSRAILLHFWHQITDGRYLLNLNTDDPRRPDCPDQSRAHAQTSNQHLATGRIRAYGRKAGHTGRKAASEGLKTKHFTV